MAGERKDFSCTPETGSASLRQHQPEVSASFEATPETARFGVKPPQAGVMDVIATVAREVVRKAERFKRKS